MTAGRSVVFAGTTVLVSLLGLRLSGLATFEAFGFATAIAVLAVMVTSLALVPAVVSLTRRWLEPRAVRPPPGPGASRHPRRRRRRGPRDGRAGWPVVRCRGWSPPPR